jgi:uridine kinase
MGRVDTMTFAQLAATIRSGRGGDGDRCQVVGVDGFSGSGKSSFAQRLAAELGAPCLGTDEMVQGWDGLSASLDALAAGVLSPLVEGAQARWRRFDWTSYRPAGWASLPASEVVVVEGCCVGVPPAGDLFSYLVWLDAPPEERRRRLRQRGDWSTFAPYFDSWSAQESALQAGARTPERADLLVDNSRPTGTAWPDDLLVLGRRRSTTVGGSDGPA